MGHPPEDKRSTGGPRARVEIEVDLSSYGKYFLSTLENVSIGGAFVRTQNTHPVGTEVTLRFRLPEDARTIEAMGEVVWIYTQAGAPEMNSSGMGVRFKQIDPDDRIRIAQYIEDETRRQPADSDDED